ncbi:MAG: arsenate reductase [Proteobacteria bacterium]|nr:arsenate reductase [Pseudomonadota bacterium]
MIDVYDFKNCDTCRKALKWLSENNFEHRFHDFRRDGLDRQKLGRWAAARGWETLLNRRSTTWRGLADTDKDGIDGAQAEALMAAHPALIKRPVFEAAGRVIVGFRDEQRKQLAG